MKRCSRCGVYTNRLEAEHYYKMSIFDESSSGGNYSYLSGTSYACSCEKCNMRWNKFSFGRRRIMQDNIKYGNHKLTEKLLKEYETAHYKKYGKDVSNWFNDVSEADWYKD